MGRSRVLKLGAVAVGAIVVVIVGAGFWVDARREVSTTLDRRDAVDLAGAASEAAPQPAPGARPTPGVWTFTGSGSDRFDAFGGSSHAFPEEIYTVVELRDGDSCRWSWTVPFVEEHVETRQMCTRSSSVSNPKLERMTIFLGREQVSRYECGARAWRLPPGNQTTEWAWRCTEDRGGRVSYTATLEGVEDVELGDGSTVSTKRVRIEGRQRDDRATSRETTRLWMLANGMPARFASDRSASVDTPVGTIDTAETWDYRLASMP